MRSESTKELFNSKNESTNSRITTNVKFFGIIIGLLAVAIPGITFLVVKSTIKEWTKYHMAEIAKGEVQNVIKEMPVEAMLKKEIELAVGTSKEVSLKDLAKKEEKFQTWYDKGEEAYNKGKYEDAISHFKVALDNVQNNKAGKAYTLNYIGAAYSKLGRYGKALAAFDKAIDLKISKHFRPYFNKGAIYNRLGNHKEAIENLKEAIIVNPKFISSYTALSVVYTNIGDYEKASEVLQSLKDINISD